MVVSSLLPVCSLLLLPLVLRLLCCPGCWLKSGWLAVPAC